jgi:hypothetical protein
MQKTNAKKCLSDSPSQKNATTERIFSELPAKDARHGIRFGTHAFFPQPRRLFSVEYSSCSAPLPLDTVILSYPCLYVNSFRKIFLLRNSKTAMSHKKSG